jgi:hypothetical protein
MSTSVPNAMGSTSGCAAARKLWWMSECVGSMSSVLNRIDGPR